MSGLNWLSDGMWAVLEPHLPRNRPSAPRVDDRRVISGILHVLRSGYDADKKMPTTATRDIAATAAKLLLDTTRTGQEETPVINPEDLSFSDIAAIITDVLGREVRYQQIPFEAFKTRLRERGVSESFAQGYVELMQAKNAGLDNVAERASSVAAPTSFRQWRELKFKPAMAAGRLGSSQSGAPDVVRQE